MLEGLHPVFLALFIMMRCLCLPQSTGNLQGRSSGFRIRLLTAPSHLALTRQWHGAAFVPDYSGGTTPEFNGIPF
jgi:type III secretory pathway component EscS